MTLKSITKSKKKVNYVPKQHAHNIILSRGGSSGIDAIETSEHTPKHGHELTGHNGITFGVAAPALLHKSR